MQLMAACVVALCLSPAVAIAQETTSPFQYSGVAKIENLSVDGHGRNFAFAEFDVGYRLPLDGGFKIGADVGIDAVQISGDRADAVFAAAVLDTHYGKLSVGMPRLVIPQVFDTPAIGGSEVAQLAAGLLTGEILRFINLLPNTPDLRGVRYDATFGKVTVAAALHEFDNTSTPLRQIAVTYDGGDWNATLGAQGINIGPVKEHQIKLALRGTHGKFSGGIVATMQTIAKGDENAVEVYGGYDVTDRVRVEAQLINVVVGGSANKVWGMDASYSLPSGAFVQGGVARMVASDTSLVNVGFGYKF